MEYINPGNPSGLVEQFYKYFSNKSLAFSILACVLAGAGVKREFLGARAWEKEETREEGELISFSRLARFFPSLARHSNLRSITPIQPASFHVFTWRNVLLF